LAGSGVTADKVAVLNSRLASLNAILKNGAQAAHFNAVAVSFAGPNCVQTSRLSKG
jgi:hypothetical protein